MRPGQIKILLALCMLSLALPSCANPTGSPNPSPQASPTARIETLEAFESALSKAATAFEPQAEIDMLEGLDGRRYQVNGETLVAFQAKPTMNEAGVEAALAKLSSEASAPTHRWQNDQFVVVYEGSEGGLILLLSGLLGDPQVAEKPAQDEPYPPAVLAAISWISEQNDFTPAEVDVVSYESVHWPDSCLGVPTADEACTGDPVPGWRIQLNVDDRSWQVHTDEFGQRVRLR